MDWTMDRRLLASNGRVANEKLRGKVTAGRFVASTRYMVVASISPILPAPDPTGLRDRELAFGETFDCLSIADGFAFGSAARDGYVGYVQADQISKNFLKPTHRVVAQSYRRHTPALKASSPPYHMPIGARVAVREVYHDHCDWAEIDLPTADSTVNNGCAYMPMQHLQALVPAAYDAVSEAERYLGVPYLWAGNSGFGIDCSGLVQAALLACGKSCPGDSDQQETDFPNASGPYQPGDLLFWEGHVALVSNPSTLIHASAHHMSVIHEPIIAALDRIQSQGGGPLTAHKRP
ncbi:NlpC/P60 family protein [Pseudopelagicola sp. nBUS_20]|uniref:C40 family peptidase n=1 Tax=Pseudopelagicola sp. nBUS_20 TaxID=3395317 RepID=UPI003EBA7978